jgi:hypothetical protein
MICSERTTVLASSTDQDEHILGAFNLQGYPMPTYLDYATAAMIEAKLV